jgi:hypothetical protein
MPGGLTRHAGKEKTPAHCTGALVWPGYSFSPHAERGSFRRHGRRDGGGPATLGAQIQRRTLLR